MSDEIVSFLEMMAAERGAARHTLDAYRRDLVDFRAFLARRGLDLAGADGDAIRAYLAHLTDLGLRPCESGTWACSRGHPGLWSLRQTEQGGVQRRPRGRQASRVGNSSCGRTRSGAPAIGAGTVPASRAPQAR